MKMAEEYQEMSSSLIQGGPLSIGEIEPTLMEPTPPTTARQPLISKREPMEFDSGTATGTEFGSSSPESDLSENLNLYKTMQSQPGHTNQQDLSAHSIYKSELFPLTPANSALMASPENPIGIERSDSPRQDGISTPPVEENMVKTPGIGSSKGKVKKFKCKQCDFFSMTKLDYWEHIKTHMEPGKALTCPHCPFVTQFKHHLLYHLRNHDGLKPFKCDKCSYSGVNRSMLNSHMKSHSNIYQYRCANCPFASKYIHSLKIHLRKNSHSPGMFLNADGTPNPSPIIGVYGTSRGPKIEITEQKQASPMLHNANMPISFTGFPHFPVSLNGIPNAYLSKMENMRSDIQAISPESNVPSGLSTDSEENESSNWDPSNRGEPNESDFSENDDEKEDRQTYTTIFDNVEVVDNSPMVEIDGTGDETENLKLNVLESKHSPTIVNGTRRGPKIMNPGYKPASPNPNILPVAPFSLDQVLATAANMSIRFPGFSFYSGFLNGSSSPLMMEIERLTRKMQAVSRL